MDTNMYINFKGYDSLHQNQIDWYKSEVLKLKQRYGADARSMLYIHMPFYEFKEARELWEAGSDLVIPIYGENREKNSVSYFRCGIFEAILELGSTKGVFAGHDHHNNWSAEYKGIRLTYAFTIDYIAYPFAEFSNIQRGGTVTDFSYDGVYNDFEIKPAPQTNGFRVIGE
jgi:hypothetical protein